jgi:hypothetical protein
MHDKRHAAHDVFCSQVAFQYIAEFGLLLEPLCDRLIYQWRPTRGRLAFGIFRVLEKYVEGLKEMADVVGADHENQQVPPGSL